MSGQHLYIIQSAKTGAVKIGRSDNPQKRLEVLQTSNANQLRLLAVFKDKGCQEKGIHAIVKQYHLSGEWFHYDCLPNLPDWIYELLPFDDRWFMS